MKLKIALAEYCQRRKLEVAISPTNFLFVMSVSLSVHCHFLAGVCSVQQQEQPFIFWGVVVLLEYFRKKFCTPELSCQSPPSVFTLGTYYSCLALSRLEIRYRNAFWLVSLYGAAQCSFVFSTAPQTNCSAQKLLPLRSLLKMWWRLSRLVSLFNFHSHISGSN